MYVRCKRRSIELSSTIPFGDYALASSLRSGQREEEEGYQGQQNAVHGTRFGKTYERGEKEAEGEEGKGTNEGEEELGSQGDMPVSASRFTQTGKVQL
jgi:hypothetical protein